MTTRHPSSAIVEGLLLAIGLVSQQTKQTLYCINYLGPMCLVDLDTVVSGNSRQCIHTVKKVSAERCSRLLARDALLCMLACWIRIRWISAASTR